MLNFNDSTVLDNLGLEIQEMLNSGELEIE